MRDEFERISAREDSDPDRWERPRAKRKERSLVADIALGIWLGGMALTISWAVLGFLWMGLVMRALGMQ